METNFFTNEKENTLLEKIEGVFKYKKVHFFDALVGYFRASGYFRIRKFIQQTPKIRILVGINVDKLTYQANQQDSDHPLLTSSPKITNYFKNCCDKLPLGITEEMLMKYCKISGVSINDYLGGARISALIIKAIKA